VLAGAYQANGQIEEAVRLLEQVVVIEGRVLAEDHPSRLASQAVLASAYQVKDAMRLLEQVVAIEGRVPAEDHPDRLASQHNLAGAYQANGQVKDAVRLLEQVVAIRERVLAEDHPDRLASQRSLAKAHQACRQLERVDSQLIGQVDDHRAASPSTTRSIAELEKPLPRRSQRTRHPTHDTPSLAEGDKEVKRRKPSNLSRKRKRK
jgi:tetratricopeptide (TPR) repeat protein